jgi:hypothetical protein
MFRHVDRHGRLLDRMSPKAVAIVVKRYAAAAGLDPAKYAGHSLRAGLVTLAAMNGAPEIAIMKQTRHTSSDMLRKYMRDVSLFRENASARVAVIRKAEGEAQFFEDCLNVHLSAPNAPPGFDPRRSLGHPLRLQVSAPLRRVAHVAR